MTHVAPGKLPDLPGATPPWFAVVGTGRCGTGYTSRVLTVCGLDCGHENWWTPDPARLRPGMDGDASWLAVPDIERGAWRGPVLHVVREPVAVVRSLVGIGFWVHDTAFQRFALGHEPELAGMDPVSASVEWWVRWNARCSLVADLTVDAADVVDRLGEIGALLGRHLDPDRAHIVPRTANHRVRAQVDVGAVWELLAGCETFGYERRAA